MKNNQITKTEKAKLNKWTPSFIIKIGVIINIVFCTLMSLVLPLLIITIPAIVLNALLLIPRVDTKRYYAIWRIIPVVLVLILTSIIVISLFFIITLTIDAYDSFAGFTDKYIIFWTSKKIMPSATIGAWFDILLGVIAGIGITGSALISIGWYWRKEIGIIEVEAKEPKKVKEK